MRKYLLMILVGVPTLLFSQTKAVDSRTVVAEFQKLSQTDFQIDSQSSTFSEKEAYTKLKDADADTNGLITYMEYLNYLNKTILNSVTKFDFIMAQLLPALTDLSFDSKGSTVGTGVLTKDFSLSSTTGDIVIPAGSKATIAQNVLLIDSKVGITANGYTAKSEKGSLIVLPYESRTLGDILSREEIDLNRAKELMRTPVMVKRDGGTKDFNQGILEMLGMFFPGSNTIDQISNASMFITAIEHPVKGLNIADIDALDVSVSVKDYLKKLKKGMVIDGPGQAVFCEAFFNQLYPGVIIDRGFSMLNTTISSSVVSSAKTLLNKDDIATIAVQETFNWFKGNPPAADGSNFEARRAHSAFLDQLGWQISSGSWNNYVNRQVNVSATEKKFPILQYLKMADQAVLAEIKATKLTDGVRIWQLYNMGIIVKTPDKTFAIDLQQSPSGTDFSSVLDFAIVSHWHPDHLDADFVALMSKAKKPVYGPDKMARNGTQALAGINPVTKDTVIPVGPLTLKLIMSSQANPSDGVYYAPDLISIIDCGAKTGNFRVMHAGDSTHINDFPEWQNIDYFSVSSDFWLGNFASQSKLVSGSDRIESRFYNLSHLMELGHGEGKELYERLGRAPAVSMNNVWGLTWGESILFNAKKEYLGSGR